MANLTVVDSLKIKARKEAFDWYNLPDVHAADFKNFTIEQEIDHFDSKSKLGKFKQRYWINDNYVKQSEPNGPPLKQADIVLLEVCGEGPCVHKDGHMIEH